METQRFFRLAVWRPAKPIRPFHYVFEGTDEHSYRIFEQDRLHEQIYAWDPGQVDIFLGLDETLSSRFRGILFDGFAPHLAPQKRSISALYDVVSVLTLELSKRGNYSWSPSEQTIEIEEDDEANLPVNAALALLNHLRWVAKIFMNVPYASVTIR
jgi:hypothetical protein